MSDTKSHPACEHYHMAAAAHIAAASATFKLWSHSTGRRSGKFGGHAKKSAA